MEDSAAGRKSLPRIAWIAFRRFQAHHMTDSAASLTYYAMMSLFPALLTAVSLLGLIGNTTVATSAANYLAKHGANPTTSTAIHDVLRTLTTTSASKSGVTFAIALALSLNGASGAYGAAGRALNRVEGISEERSFVRRKLADIGATIMVLLLLMAVVVALFLGGGIADDLFGRVGLGSTAATIWSIIRWPAAIAGALLAYALVYAYAPDLEERRTRWLSPGAVTAVAIWILGSIGFALFLRNVPSYGTAYGTFGAAIILLLWLFITANAFLYGAELNATLAAEGHAPAATSTARPGPGT